MLHYTSERFKDVCSQNAMGCFKTASFSLEKVSIVEVTVSPRESSGMVKGQMVAQKHGHGIKKTGGVRPLF